MKTLATLPFAALALSACTMTMPGDDGPGTYPPPPSSKNYRAVGTEPFWSVAIGGGAMRYESAEGRIVTVPTPRPRVGINGERYETRRLTVDITHVRCSDGMSDRSYPDTVRVTVDGRRLNGCGGESGLGMAPLDGTSWRVANIDGTRAQFSTIAFAEGRISGRACNSFSGTYRVQGERLITGPIMATKMACPGPRMTEENALLGALRGPLTIRERNNGRMVLVSQNGRRIVLAPQ
ncbi:META domain-containing protein [Sphingomonas gilva]|nr:META domain-containing protein [Sphingomonas gilva]